MFIENGSIRRVKIPKIGFEETDTTISINPSITSLVYDAEKHTDKITGVQLGSIINLDDLKNTDIDPSLSGKCYELIYHKWGDCGDGCKSLSDTWQNFNINSEGAKQNGIRYVRGANAYGCPVYLDVPTDTSTYWWGMWRPNDTGTGLEFGYIQPETRSSLPTNPDGKQMVLSQDANGKPIWAPIDTSFSLCGGVTKFVCRSADSEIGAGWWTAWSADAYQDFLVTPDNNTSWRAPSCGIMIVTYCVNVYKVAGAFEVDTTLLSSNSGSWTPADEDRDSTHSTWDTTGDSGVSETCTAFAPVAAGETLRLHARVYSVGTPSAGAEFRVHAVKAMFVPLSKS